MASTPSSGLRPHTRARLQLLHGLGKPFWLEEAAATLHLDRPRTRRLLADLVRGGWLTRARRGLYSAVPFETKDPGAWTDDPWRLAARLFAPGYVSGFSALHHWELTDQVFRTLVVFTARPVRRASVRLHGSSFLLHHRPDAGRWGTRKVWREAAPVLVADPSLALIDSLDTPSVGGGIRHIAECLVAYWSSEHRAPEKLLTYAERVGNRVVYKRLGYLLEHLRLGDERLRAACRERLSAGVSLLDPGVAAHGPIVSRWRLRTNVHVGPA